MPVGVDLSKILTQPVRPDNSYEGFLESVEKLEILDHVSLTPSWARTHTRSSYWISLMSDATSFVVYKAWYIDSARIGAACGVFPDDHSAKMFYKTSIANKQAHKNGKGPVWVVRERFKSPKASNVVANDSFGELEIFDDFSKLKPLPKPPRVTVGMTLPGHYSQAVAMAAGGGAGTSTNNPVEPNIVPAKPKTKKEPKAQISRKGKTDWW